MIKFEIEIKKPYSKDGMYMGYLSAFLFKKKIFKIFINSFTHQYFKN